MNNVLCIYDKTNVDSILAAGVVLEHYLSNKVERYTHQTQAISKDELPRNWIVTLGWELGDMIPMYEQYTIIILCGVSFPEDIMKDLIDSFSNNFIWIDNNCAALSGYHAGVYGIQNSCTALSYLVWQLFKGTVPPKFIEQLSKYLFASLESAIGPNIVNNYYGLLAHIKNPYSAFMLVKDNDLQDILIEQGSIVRAGLLSIKRTIFSVPTVVSIPYSNSFYDFLAYNTHFNPMDFILNKSILYHGLMTYHRGNNGWIIQLYSYTYDLTYFGQQYQGIGTKTYAKFIIDNLKIFMQNGERSIPMD